MSEVIQLEMIAMDRLMQQPSQLGSSWEWSPLVGECLSVTVNEKDSLSGSFAPIPKDYNYLFCPFLYLLQSSKEDEASTLLGIWKGWDPQDHEVMIYSDGSPCGTSGIPREVRVRVECFPESKILGVREDGQCGYLFLWGSPAACNSKRKETLQGLFVDSVRDFNDCDTTVISPN